MSQLQSNERVTVDETDLAREDLEVLREVANRDRPATTSDVMATLGWAEESHHVTYRFDKLEECGLIRTQKDPDRGPANQLPPRVAEATDVGKELLDSIDFDAGSAPVEERLDALEKQVSRMRETYGEVKQRIVEIEGDIEDHDEDLDDLAEDVENVKRFLAENER